METDYIEWPDDNDPNIVVRWIDSWWKQNPPEKNHDPEPVAAFTWDEFIKLWITHARHQDKIVLVKSRHYPQAYLRGLIEKEIVFDEISTTNFGMEQKIPVVTKEDIEAATMAIRNLAALIPGNGCQYVTNQAKGLVCGEPRDAQIHSIPFGHEYQENSSD